MNDIEASLGSSQLNKQKDYQRKNEIAITTKKFESKNIRFQKVDKLSKSSYHLFIIKQ